MKMPFKDLLSKEGKKILTRYEKYANQTINSVDDLIAEVNGKMKKIRSYGDASYVLAGEAKHAEAYLYVLHTRDDIGIAFDRKIGYIQHRIKEIEDGIKILETSNSITLLISDFEKSIIIDSLVRCINYLRASQSKIDGSRVMLFNYTETILQSIGKGSTSLSYTYDTATKEMYTSIGHRVENTVEKLPEKENDAPDQEEESEIETVEDTTDALDVDDTESGENEE